jgi:uncharacterized protein (DUF58 family)/TM2 domain-containing membrane protein YozV
MKTRCPNCKESVDRRWKYCTSCQAALPRFAAVRVRPVSQRTKLLMAVLWIFASGFGGPRFYLGHTRTAVAQLLVTLFTCGVGWWWGFIDGFFLLVGEPTDSQGLPVSGWFSPRGEVMDVYERRAKPVGRSLLGIAFHGGVLFAAPFITGGVLSAFVDTSEVVDTAGTLVLLVAACVAPVFLAQVAGVTVKTRQELRLLRGRGSVTWRTTLDAVDRNLHVLSGRGYTVFFGSLVVVSFSLSVKWASLGVLATLALMLLYLVVGVMTAASAFLVRSFDVAIRDRQGAVLRRFEPSIARVGDAVTDAFDISRVPVPPGTYLLLEDDLDPRLETRARHVVPREARAKSVRVSARVRRTARGVFDCGPARVSFQDLFGLTKVSVASLAQARLKVLPKLQPVEVIAPPPTQTEEPDILARPHRFPTDDFFRFREYVPGDDTRRLHWKLTMKMGELMVRLPESREVDSKRVLIVLDTHVPEAWLHRRAVLGDVLDGLVDVWLSTAHRLVEQGEKVSIAAMLPDDRGALQRELITCRRGKRQSWLDAGARAEWQCQYDVHALVEMLRRDDDVDDVIVLTSRLAPVNALSWRATNTTWIYLHPRDTLPPPPPGLVDLWLNWNDQRAALTGGQKLMRFVQLPHPAGSEENAVTRRVKRFTQREQDANHQTFIQREVVLAGDAALGSLMASGDTVYRMEVDEGHYRLRGLRASEPAHPPPSSSLTSAPTPSSTAEAVR